VVARRTHQGRPAVVLDRTAFYAESGGQPWDTGTLGGVPVLAVLHAGGEVLHLLERELSAERVQGRVDGDRRRDHRQQHHGQHLLSRAFVEVAGAATASFHLGAETCSIDLDRAIDGAAAERAEARANEVAWDARPVTVRVLSRAQAEGEGLHVPEEAGDTVRVVEAEGFDTQPCGGTHPARTSEVGVVLVLGHERYKSGSRVRFVCGDRALREWRRRQGVLDRLGALLSSPPSALPESVEKLSAGLQAAERRAEDARQRLVEVEADRLRARMSSDGLLSAVLPGWDPESLRLLAGRLTAMAPGLVMLAGVTDRTHLVFAQSIGHGHDVPALLREAAGRLGGKGGGRGDLAQGSADRVDGVADALEAAAGRARAGRAGA
jgi:alanyl-tRNA synthetase